MNVTDRPKRYYEHEDNTDSTPYEDDDVILDGSMCMICGDEFHKGDEVMRMEHFYLAHDRFLMHRRCFIQQFPRKHQQDAFVDTMEILGFEVQGEPDY